ncbi:NAD-dependent deacylase [Acidocella sp.]|uniref:NAD-dependent deacylase n=1 Tax=Acidocella sp. TaxID=50710 RepID=UPI003CFEC513
MNLVVLTGAGISAESGISTFRAADGLWENHRIEDVASPEGFMRDPALVHHFYNLRRAQLHEVVPNKAHQALAALERAWRGRGAFLLVTQNVDDLHERAGSRALRHMHGELRRLLCTACGETGPWHDDAGVDTPCPDCGAEAMRPDIVWFGEIPHHMDEIMEALGQADLFCAIGTSGVVYPAAGFAAQARRNGRNCVLYEINPTPTGGRYFDHVIAAPASEGVPELLCRLGVGADS